MGICANYVRKLFGSVSGRTVALLGAFLVVIFYVPIAMAETVIKVDAGANAQEELQEALILVESGQTIELGEGIFVLSDGLSLDVDNVTVRGQGMDKTILSFRDQKGGSEGLLVTSDQVILQDFAVEDSKGDAIKSKGVDGIAMINLRVEWTDGPKSTNGAYGLYPVQSKNVFIHGCVAIGASDAGIYVGQSDRIIVANSRGEFNVAGLEIENSYNADVFDNVLTRNTGGLLVFDLPNLPQQGGHNVRFFRNKSFNNDTPNFAPEGNIVGIVPRGTGMIVMANENVEIFENEFYENDTMNIVVASYVDDFDDENYQPTPRKIHIHHNKFGKSGLDPDTGEFGAIVRETLGTPVPDIVWDGVLPLMDYFVFGQDEEHKLAIHDNIHLDGVRPFGNANLIMHVIAPIFHKAHYDMSPYQKSYPPLPPVEVIIRGKNAMELVQ
ncbi:parallel beta-helix domain-containing protein [Sneathiella glossodoripedis]|uniref:parallel beta-helix domain-containing protein n=1 Tax=Sneathiella glossodoripedis TaxID=418853 RepID=UPI0004723C2A|nr:parallel beta-helix domain-containing protein [Sneathiella glossodoripedis]